MLPDRPTVRSRSRRENWSIDEGPSAVMSPEDMELSGSRMNAPSSTTLNSSYHDRPASGHSRSESATSLLSSPSAKTNTSWISAITNFLPTAKAYQSGVKKEKDYKRVRVMHSPLPGTVDLEGEPYDPALPPAPPPSAYSTYKSTVTTASSPPGNGQAGPSAQQDPPQRRQDSLPSFVDIRRQSTGLESTSRHAT